jgi:hypothetical protein
MNDFQFLQVTMQVSELTSSTEYRQAMLLSRRRGPENLANADKNSEEYAAVRLLIGTWNEIATFCGGFSAKQRSQFFRSHPVSLAWQYLEPATLIIRQDIDEVFAMEFESLHKQYQKWIESRGGRRYTTGQLQAINAKFLV